MMKEEPLCPFRSNFARMATAEDSSPGPSAAIVFHAI